MTDEARDRTDEDPVVVVKAGGGVVAARGADGLDGLGADLAEAAADRRLLVVPGGGAFADAVRAADADLGLDARTSHVMALLAMDQLGHVLLERTPTAVAVDALDAAAVPRDRPGVLLAARELAAEPTLPASWDVGADSVALHVARRLGAARLVLLKAAGGLHGAWPAEEPPLPWVTVADLDRPDGPVGGVDRAFAAGLAGWEGEAWVVDGRVPGLLAATLAGREAPGTRVRPAL